MEKGKETKGKLTTEPNIQRTSEEERDRLSELPDFVLLHIMNFIDTKDALRTCILSKRWKDLWKHLTTFSFDQSTSLFDERRVVNFNKFVSQVLSCWDGSISLINVRLVIFESIGSQLLNRIMKCVVLHNDAKTMMQKYSSYLILTIPTCNLLNTLVLNYCFLHNDAKILFISNSNLSSLKLKNLKIRDTFQHKVVLSTPNLSSLTVYFFGVSSFTIQPLSSTCNLSCLEEGTIDIATDISHPVLIGWLQVFSNVKILTLSYQTLKLILKDLSNLATMRSQRPCFVILESLKVVIDRFRVISDEETFVTARYPGTTSRYRLFQISCCLVDLNYWDSISTLVGEVVLGYFPFVLVATIVVPFNRELWTDGYFSIIADIVGGVWLWWLQAIVAMSNMEMFVAEMSSDSFQLLGMAERGMLLEFFGKRSC
ncbi:hypothetical protein JHK84_028319 [Glycine max]|nr:hypothetical protein JHK84_028319 [Glycine max]